MKTARNRYLSDDNEDFTVSSRESIIHLLRGLSHGNVTLSGIFNSGKDVLLTAVLSVDSDEDVVYLDINANEERNREFLRSSRIVFVAQVDGAKIQWSTLSIEDGGFEGGRAFRVPLPETLQRIQRRTAFRVNTPITNPVMCHIPVAPDRELALPLVDICVEGIGVILPDAADPAMVKNARFEHCSLVHEELRINELTLSVQNIWEVTLKNGHVSQRAGLEFIDMRQQDEPIIQRFVFKLERLRISTLKGH
ncbi:MAG: flagellar brake protein [Rhodocyclaceae bacterium]|nr:flagellar brake protein [Rhodocyclaceae bacterium]MDZ4214359.1 flagellar brake protein [Rhodocyclaceae bacterium]